MLGNRCSQIISGDISPAVRQQIVDEFNAAEDGAVLVSQVQADGTGLNIQAASLAVVGCCSIGEKDSIWGV